MSYDVNYSGELSIEPPLNDAEISYLEAFAISRRYRRFNHGPLAVEPVDIWDDPDTSRLGISRPPLGQPGYYCRFSSYNNGATLGWDETECADYGAEWIAFIVSRLLSPEARAYIDEHINDDPRLASFTTNHILNGEITAFGEDSGDIWRITVENNVVKRWEIELTPVNSQEITVSTDPV